MDSRRILLLDDHPFQREHMASMLRPIPGAVVETTGDALVALAMCRQQSFHLVVTDLRMPGMDGIQFIQRLARVRNKPLLVLSSAESRNLLTATARIAEFLGLVVVDFLPKPITLQDVQQLLANIERVRRVDRHPGHHHAPLSAGRAELKQAMDSGRMGAWFQPKVCLESGAMVGAEALVRWQHPRLGVIGPERFMDLVVQMGLELELLWRMVSDTARAQKRFSLEGVSMPFSVNLPTHLLSRQSLPEEIHGMVSALGGTPELLCLELLESSMANSPADYYACACRLRLKGFGLAQDDFGRGTSSLHSLSTLPFSEVKIDRGLVQGCSTDQERYAALSSIIVLSRKLDLVCTAEGVESLADLVVLRELGCQRAQGYYFSPAVDLDSLLRGFGETRAQ